MNDQNHDDDHDHDNDTIKTIVPVGPIINALYIQHSDGLWYQHQRSTGQCRTRASTLTFETAGCTQQQLPIGATIVDVRKKKRKSLCSAGSNFRA